tara:strand:+ start:1414 stop:2166 length:753 start_codon:yes stop_codon:yes gene_type:complete
MKNKTFLLLDELINTLKVLRSPGGCDWDRKQTTKSLIPYLLEETYELIEAIEDDKYENIKEELGDLLLHIIFQTELAYENNKFSLDDVIYDIKSKLVKRHPHIFSNNKNEHNWELAKQQEKKRKRVLDGVPKALPALSRANRIQEKAASIGFNWSDIDLIFDKIHEEYNELIDAYEIANKARVKEELGDLLFTIVNLSRFLEINSEEALKLAIKKFEDRFYKVENEIKSECKTFANYSPEELQELWNKLK